MADERRYREIRRPTQKRLDEALERGDVVKSQEVNTWFVLGAATLSCFVFRLDERRRLTTLRGFLGQAHKFRSTGAASSSSREARDRNHRGRRDPVPDPRAGGDGRQHRPAPSGLVGRKPQAEALEDLARRRLQAAVLQDRARELRQGPDQARDRRHHHGRDPVAEARPARRPDDDGPGDRAAADPHMSLDMLGAVVAVLAIVAAAD